MSTKTGPLFKDVDDFHEALVGYAKQALAQALIRAGAEGKKLDEVFPEEAKERFAQIAMSVWMDHEEDLSEARGGKVEVDGIPLSSIEEVIYGSAFAERDAITRRRNDVAEGSATIALDDAIRAVRRFRAVGSGR